MKYSGVKKTVEKLLHRKNSLTGNIHTETSVFLFTQHTIPHPQDVVYPSVYLYLKGLHFVAIPSLSAIHSFGEKKIALKS